MTEIMKISNKNGIKVIEDCAHAIETKYKNREVGNLVIQAVIVFILIKI